MQLINLFSHFIYLLELFHVTAVKTDFVQTKAELFFLPMAVSGEKFARFVENCAHFVDVDSNSAMMRK